ncbi:Peroxidase [Rhynchospora pubera]|uniref:Peroxidase n=1 Tax=Rhynchospora pubera TaxID=906938 RepID=A0AAV8D8Q5_9POAL|nr:Peroxidase [Rhynchospora pubera]
MAMITVTKSLLPILAIVLLFSTTVNSQGLVVGFYNSTCPNAETIIRNEVIDILTKARTLAGPLLRMFFHDCFVNGCDGSVLLNGTKTDPAERDSIPNLSLRGFSAIDKVKAKLEAACPRTVSCADIVAIVARDVVVLTKGPTWDVLMGRRDGNRSVSNDALANLPPPFVSAQQALNQFYIPKGLDAKDQLVLSGGHTLGTSHCSSFNDRLYDFNKTNKADPRIDRFYRKKLEDKCKPNDQTTLVEMDPGSFLTFDNGYFKQLAKRRSLFFSDDTLMLDPINRAYIKRQALNGADTTEFFTDFAASMIKMGNIGVLTGTQGEIRKHCALVNK